MKYLIKKMANPSDFVKNDHIKIHPWVPYAKNHIKSAEVKDGHGEYLAFPVELENAYGVIIDGKGVSFADVILDLDVYPWESNRVFIVDDIIWLEAIEGGLKMFHVEEVIHD